MTTPTLLEKGSIFGIYPTTPENRPAGFDALGICSRRGGEGDYSMKPCSRITSSTISVVIPKIS